VAVPQSVSFSCGLRATEFDFIGDYIRRRTGLDAVHKRKIVFPGQHDSFGRTQAGLAKQQASFYSSVIISIAIS
jgi:hypothetical protein